MDLCRKKKYSSGLPKKDDSSRIVNGSNMISRLQHSTKTKPVLKTSIRSTLFFKKQLLSHSGFARFLKGHPQKSLPIPSEGQKKDNEDILFHKALHCVHLDLWVLFETILQTCSHWQVLNTWWIKKGHKGLQTTNSQLYCMPISSTCRKKYNPQIHARIPWFGEELP